MVDTPFSKARRRMACQSSLWKESSKWATKTPMRRGRSGESERRAEVSVSIDASEEGLMGVLMVVDEGSRRRGVSNDTPSGRTCNPERGSRCCEADRLTPRRSPLQSPAGEPRDNVPLGDHEQGHRRHHGQSE